MFVFPCRVVVPSHRSPFTLARDRRCTLAMTWTRREEPLKIGLAALTVEAG